MPNKKKTLEQLRVKLENAIADSERKENCSADETRSAFKAHNALQLKAKRGYDLTPEELIKMETLKTFHQLENSFEIRQKITALTQSFQSGISRYSDGHCFYCNSSCFGYFQC